MIRVDLELKPPPARNFEKMRTGKSLEEILVQIHKEYPGHFVKVIGVLEVAGEQTELLKGGAES